MMGLGKVPEASTMAPVVSAQGQAIADALINYSKQVKQMPILRGVRYDGIAFQEARARAASLTERVAGGVGTTTMESEDFKQLLIGGANLTYTLGLNCRVTSFLEGGQYRAYEQRVQAFAQTFQPKMVELAQQGSQSGALRGLQGGLGFIIVGVVLVLLAAYLLSLDDGEQLANDLCTQDPTSEACRRALDIYQENKQDPGDPFSQGIEGLFGSVGSVIKWVGIGAAVLGVGYLLWVFGPALISGGRKVRGRWKARASS